MKGAEGVILCFASRKACVGISNCLGMTTRLGVKYEM